MAPTMKHNHYRGPFNRSRERLSSSWTQDTSSSSWSASSSLSSSTPCSHWTHTPMWMENPSDLHIIMITKGEQQTIQPIIRGPHEAHSHLIQADSGWEKEVPASSFPEEHSHSLFDGTRLKFNDVRHKNGCGHVTFYQSSVDATPTSASWFL